MQNSQFKNTIDYFKEVLKNYTIEEIPLIDPFGERLFHYLKSIVLIFCCAFVITLFHPTSLSAKLFIATVFSLVFGVTILFFIEGAYYLNKKRSVPHTAVPAYRLWINSLVIFLSGFGLFSVFEIQIINADGFGFLDFYGDNLESYRPFSLVFLAKMSPIYLIVAINVFRRLKSKEQKKKDNSIPEKESMTINVGKEMEIIDTKTITHISVQEHYSRYYVNTEDSRKEIEAHQSLTNSLASLPSSEFIRVHRSHAVNLLHVNGLKQIENQPHVVIGKDEFYVPVSRRQYAEVKKRIAEYHDATGVKS